MLKNLHEIISLMTYILQLAVYRESNKLTRRSDFGGLLLLGYASFLKAAS